MALTRRSCQDHLPIGDLVSILTADIAKGTQTMAGRSRRTKVSRRGQAGGCASGKVRQRSDNLEIWVAYQQVRGTRHGVKALADQYGLTRRRIRQIGTGSKPDVIENTKAGFPPVVDPTLLAPSPEDIVRLEYARLLQAVEADLAAMEGYAREIAAALAQAEAGQLSMYSRVVDAEALMNRIRLTRIRVNRKINQ